MTAAGSAAGPVSYGTPYLGRKVPLPPINPGEAPIPWIATVLIVAGLLVKTVLILYLVLWLVILIHELGHVIAGALVNFKFRSLRVGPVIIDYRSRLGWEWKRGKLTTGMAVMVPKSDSALWTKKVIFTLGGPLLNLLVGFSVQQVLSTAESLWFAVGELFAVLSIMVGFCNFLPGRFYGQMSDGLTLCILLFDRRKRERIMFNLRAQVKTSKGSYDRMEIDELTSVADDSASHVYANWTAYAQCEREGRHEDAGRYLDNCLAGSTSINLDFRRILMLESAKFQARGRKRLDLAQEWLAADKQKRRDGFRILAEAIVSSRGGDLNAVLRLIDEGEALCQRGKDDLSVQFWRDWRQLLQSKTAIATSADDAAAASVGSPASTVSHLESDN